MEIILTIFIFTEQTSYVSIVIVSYSLSVSAADEEKLDERAKLSVAAKRSLFRVSFNSACLPSLNVLSINNN